jgi:serine/threonine protein phosphatase 1
LKTVPSKWTNAHAPEGVCLYAIGDIHGRDDLLGKLLAAIEHDRRGHAAADARLIFLGDYVDRGPTSKEVIERLSAGVPQGFAPYFLKGNHEDLLLSFLEDPAAGLNWLHNGGDATLFSYGVPREAILRGFWAGPQGLLDAAKMFDSLLPEEHRRFFQALATSYRAGDYYFVHAGIRPGVPLDAQVEDDMLWIRDEFLTWSGNFDAVIVHGHTPVRAPEDLPNRIGIDTYAFHTGTLTAVGLEGERRWFIST